MRKVILDGLDIQKESESAQLHMLLEVKLNFLGRIKP